METNYDVQFTAFIDFLGFSEVSKQSDETTRLNVLELLKSLAALRGDFDLQKTVQEGSSNTFYIKPAVSSFSDHIVISFPLQPIYSEFNERMAPFVIANNFTTLLTAIAAEALRIGFLVRGGATIGRLYHAEGVVFGEALVEAFQIESRTAIYPRIVLSQKITSQPGWTVNKTVVKQDTDGLYYFDYFQRLLLRASLPASNYAAGVKAWFDAVVPLIFKNLTELERVGKLTEFSKWAWFAQKFQQGLGNHNPDLLKELGISPDMIPWLREPSDQNATV